MNHTITLPNIKWCESECSKRICNITRCFWSLPVSNEKITVQYDDGSFKVPERQKNKNQAMPNGNGKYASFFWVDKNLFMIIDADRPTKNYKEWTKYYEDQGVVAFFVACRRVSTEYIFENCNVSIFSCPFGVPSYISQKIIDEAHAEDVKKDISVFYRGKRKHNKQYRSEEWINRISEIPQSDVKNNDCQVTATEYVNLMSRSKISWIPKSCICKPYEDENVTIGRDIEAMCLDSLVLRNPLKEIQLKPKISGVHYVEYKEDCSDLIDKMQYYLEHENERKTITRNARMHYEKYCTPSGRAELMFEDCLIAIQ